MKHARTIFLCLLVIYLAVKVSELNDKAQEYSKERDSLQSVVKDNVAYDWENERYITRGMVDTMQRVQGHWFGKHQIPAKFRTRSYSKPEKEEWLRPAGRDKMKITTEEGKYLWRLQQQRERDSEQVDEDRVREIVWEELDH